MAESNVDNLDNFFAKKDKSKKKVQPKITPEDLLAKHGEDARKGKKKKKPAKEEHNEKDPALKATTEDDGEWKEFEEERRDYSGLRIQNIQISSKDEDGDGEQKSDDGSSEDGENKEKKSSGQQGPWKGQGTSIQSQVTSKEKTPIEESSKEEKKEERKEEKKEGKYIPPALRHAHTAGDHTTSSSHPHPQRRGIKQLPNIQSEDDFPTLGGAGSSSSEYASGSSELHFEKARGSSRPTENATNRRAHIELGNKYDALQGSDS